jgi:hypothetical protein
MAEERYDTCAMLRAEPISPRHRAQAPSEYRPRAKPLVYRQPEQPCAPALSPPALEVLGMHDVPPQQGYPPQPGMPLQDSPSSVHGQDGTEEHSRNGARAAASLAEPYDDGGCAAEPAGPAHPIDRCQPPAEDVAWGSYAGSDSELFLETPQLPEADIVWGSVSGTAGAPSRARPAHPNSGSSGRGLHAAAAVVVGTTAAGAAPRLAAAGRPITVRSSVAGWYQT